MKRKQNADNESERSSLSDQSKTVDVSLRWIQGQIGRVLEIFVILQFAAGAFVFFAGIFLLLWAVASATSLQAGSYMLLAFFVIGRALLGFVGYHTDNFCLLFSYGVLLVATFVVRTILTLVRLKIGTGHGRELLIPPLLQACPGAFSAPIELVCSFLECSQAFCSFYLCWIIAKTMSIEKSFDESRLNIATEIVQYLSMQQQEVSQQSKDQENGSQMEEIKCENSNVDNSKSNIKAQKELPVEMQEKEEKEGQQKRQSISALTAVPLKSILHQPNQHHQSNHVSSPKHRHHTELHSQFASNARTSLPIKSNLHVTPSIPIELRDTAHEMKNVKIASEEEVEMKEEEEEDFEQIMEDFNNNNNYIGQFRVHEAPEFNMNYRKQPYDGMKNWNQYHEYHHDSTNSASQGIHCEQISSDYYSVYEPTGYYIQSNANYYHHLNPPYADNTALVERVLSPTPPSELSSASSPLLYETPYAYHDYGSTNWQLYQQQQQ